MMVLMLLYKMMNMYECMFLLNMSKYIKSIEKCIGNNLKLIKIESIWIYSKIVGTNLLYDIEEINDFILYKYKINYINKKIGYSLDYLYLNTNPNIMIK